MFIVFFCLSLFIFFGSCTLAYKYKNSQIKALSIALGGIVLATGFLVFPLYYTSDIVTVLIETVFYAIKISAMSGDFGVLEAAPTELYEVYKYLLYLYSILAPLFAAGVIVTFIGNKVDEIRSKIKTNKTVHIFSEVNEKSVLLAETLKRYDNIIIMCDLEEKKEYYERIKNKSGIILKKDISMINLKPYHGEVKIYEISDDQDKNLNQTLELISKRKNENRDITIYLFSNLEAARVMIDSTEKGNIKTIMINEISQMVYQVLDEMPLYKNAKNEMISVLIAGIGNIGIEFLKAVSWCGQMANYQLEINIIDKNAEQIKQSFEWKCPELKEPNYQIRFHEADISTVKGKQILDKYCKNTNYIIVALGEDNRNLNMAIDLRHYFLTKNKKPIIALNIKNSEKKRQIETLKNERGNNYEFYPFGGLEDLYGDKNILNEKIEELAKRVHLSYNPTDTEFKEYYKIEYYKNSSRATALHIKYKIYSVFGREEVTLKEIREMLLNKDTRTSLARNEHARWNAYMRADGYQLASLEDVERYEKEVHHHVHHLAKLHPGLVTFEDLDNLSKNIEKVTGKKIDLKKSDYDIIDAIPDIIKD